MHSMLPAIEKGLITWISVHPSTVHLSHAFLFLFRLFLLFVHHFLLHLLFYKLLYN